MLDKLNRFLGIRAFRTNRAEFYDDLASAFVANISFDSFLKTSQEYANRLKLATASVFPIIRARYEHTQSLSGAVGTVVPETDKMVLVAAERSGNLEEGLRFLVKSIAFVQEMRSAIFMAVAMPVGMFVGLGALVGGIAVYGVPAMTELLPANQWQGSGRTLLMMSDFVRKYGLAVLIGFAGLGYGFGWSLTNWSGAERAKLDQKFPYNFWSSYQGAMLLVSMTALNQGGMSVMASLNELLSSSSPWMRWHLKKIIRNIQQNPEAFAENFNTGMYSSRIIFRMALAAASGSVESKLGIIADTAMKETLKSIQRSSAVINKIMLAIFGISLIWVFATFMLTAQTVGMQAGRAG